MNLSLLHSPFSKYTKLIAEIAEDARAFGYVDPTLPHLPRSFARLPEIL